MRPMTLTAQQVAQYHQRDGYVCSVQMMPAAESLWPWRQLVAVEARQRGKT